MTYLRGIEQAALIAVVVVFAFRGLIRYYPAFTLFLLAKGVRSFCLLGVDYHDPVYGRWWALSAPILMVLQLFVLLELTGKVVEHYRNIDRQGAKLIVGSCLTAGALMGGLLYAVRFGSGDCPWYIPAAVGAYKLLDWTAVGTLGFISVWLALYPEPMRRNLQWHRWLLAAYIGFAPGIALMFSTVSTKQRSWVDAANWGLEVAEICCSLLWSLALTRVGETFPYVPKTISDEQLARIDSDYQEVFQTLRKEYPLAELMRPH